MNSGTISMRYARALFSYTLENRVGDAVFDEMKKLSETLSKNSHIRATLDNPVLKTKDKLELIKIAAGGNVSDAFVKFVSLVLRQRRENHLQTISLLYLDLYRNHKNINVVRLVSAYSVDDVTLNKIKQLVQRTQTGTIEFVTEIDPDIAGGFILYLDSYRLDASVSSQLKHIKDQLLSKNKKVA